MTNLIDCGACMFIKYCFWAARSVLLGENSCVLWEGGWWYSLSKQKRVCLTWQWGTWFLKPQGLPGVNCELKAMGEDIAANCHQEKEDVLNRSGGLETQCPFCMADLLIAYPGATFSSYLLKDSWFYGRRRPSIPAEVSPVPGPGRWTVLSVSQPQPPHPSHPPWGLELQSLATRRQVRCGRGDKKTHPL